MTRVHYINYGNHYYQIVLLPPIHFQIIIERSKRNIFNNITNYFLEKFHISFNKLCNLECLKSDSSLNKFEFQNSLVKKTQMLFSTSHRELRELNESIEEYLYYYNILLVIVCLNSSPKYNYEIIKLETAKKVFSDIFDKKFKANRSPKINQTPFNDYLEKTIKIFIYLVIKHTILSYLGIKYNTYGETARGIADIIFEYSFNPLNYIGSFYAKADLLPMEEIKIVTYDAYSSHRSRRTYINFDSRDIRSVLLSTGEVVALQKLT